MDVFKAVYKILSTLERAMDCPEFDVSVIGAEALGISKERWTRYMEMLADEGYIKGLSFAKSITGEIIVEVSNLRITLKGVEYLQENSIMQSIYAKVHGLIDTAAGAVIGSFL